LEWREDAVLLLAPVYKLNPSELPLLLLLFEDDITTVDATEIFDDVLVANGLDVIIAPPCTCPCPCSSCCPVMEALGARPVTGDSNPSPT
jgi:hypothetical protein